MRHPWLSNVMPLRAGLLVVLLVPLVGAAEPIRFNTDVLPILSDTCFTCHGPDANARATDVRFDTRAGTFEEHDGVRAVVPGDLDASALWQRITSDDPDERMPPADSGRQLTVKQIATLKAWIEGGAAWEGHWAFNPPKRPVLPPVSTPEWTRTGIDRFVLRRLDEAGLRPSNEAARETLIRRVTLDLTGLPPTLEEVDAFLADDSPDAYDRLVDRLLASPRYGEWMALPWLDAARYADSNGYQQDRTRTAWPWRDWVVRSLNENRPYDEWTVEQLAGDLLPGATPDQLLASGFHRNHMLNGEGGRIAEESRVDYVVDRVETTSTVWLGLTLGCARCHDHKYDPFSQREFYELYAFFNNIDESGRVDAGGNANPVMPYPLPEQRAEIARLEAEVAALRRQLDDPPPVDAGDLAKWEIAQRKLLATDTALGTWRLLRPESYTSRDGQTMTLEDDLAILVSGKNPAKDVYTITATPGVARLTGLRLEALPHASMTVGGLARSDSGNFVLTHVDVALVTKEGKRTTIPIANALADHEQNGHPIVNALAKNDVGWAVLSGDMKQPRTGVFRFEESTPIPEGAKLAITLRQESRHPSHNLGRFRLAITSEDEFGLEGKPAAPAVPPAVATVLQTDPGRRTPAQRDVLVRHYRASTAWAKGLNTRIAAATSRITAVRNAFPKVMVMRERAQPRKTNVLIRGAYDKYGDEVTRALPAVLTDGDAPSDAATPPSRLDLAKWIVSPDHPLTARVTVNRHWQHFFGHGLVRTPEDFGSQGERPTHPQLLDWLATEFVRTGWDVKRLHRLIVTSATYRQSSAVTPELLEADDENRLLARAPRHRLSSLGLRDQALALAGLLVERRGGTPVFPYQPARIWEDFSFNKIKYTQSHGSDLYRRSLYMFWRRSVGPTTLFDTSSRQVCTVNVRRTNTPLHSLTTLNDTTFVEAARKFAERIQHEGGDDDASRAAWAFRLATSRRPTENEREILLRALGRGREHYTAHPDEATAVLAVGESPRDATLPAVETAAWTGVVSVILNLDEVLVRE